MNLTGGRKVDFDITEEQKQIKVLIRQFCEREVDSKEMWELANKATTAKNVEELRSIQPLHLIEKLHDVGLRQLGVPVKYEGTAPEQGCVVTQALALEEAGYIGGPVTELLSMTWIICNCVAFASITEEQREWFFSQFMGNHTMRMSVTASEPSGSTDFVLPYDEPGVAMKTTAYKDGNEWVINGDKFMSIGGGVADLLMCQARTDKEGPISKSMSIFWVPKDTPGISMTLNNLIIVPPVGNVQVCYDNVRVPESCLMGEVNNGFDITRSFFATKLLVQVAVLGYMQRLYEDVRDYAKQRIQGGRPIIEHSSVAAMLGEAAINIEAARAFIYRAAWESDQWRDKGEPINLFWNDGTYYLMKKTCWRLCELAIDVYGGVGVSVDMPLVDFLRRIFLGFPGDSTPSMNAIKCSMEYNK